MAFFRVVDDIGCVVKDVAPRPARMIHLLVMKRHPHPLWPSVEAMRSVSQKDVLQDRAVLVSLG